LINPDSSFRRDHDIGGNSWRLVDVAESHSLDRVVHSANDSISYRVPEGSNRLLLKD